VALIIPGILSASEVVLKAGGTAGSIIGRNASGVATDIAAPAAAEVITSQGAGALPGFDPADTGPISVVVSPSALTAGSDYDIFMPSDPRSSALNAHIYKNFPSARTVALADSEYRWTWVNRAKVAAADEDKTVADSFYLQPTADASDWSMYPGGGATRTAIQRYISMTFRPNVVGTMVMLQTGDWAHNSQTFTAGWVNPADLNGVAVVGTGDFGGTYACIHTTTGSWQVAGVTAGELAAGVWLRSDYHCDAAGNLHITAYYSKTVSGLTVPTDWVLLGSGSTVMSRGANRFAIMATNLAAQANHFGAIKYLDLDYYNTRPFTLPPNPCLETTTTPAGQQLIDDQDCGTLPATETATRALWRSILADVANRFYGDSATITWSAKAAAAVGATEGTYYSAAAFEFSEWAGPYVSLWVKVTSDGFTQGSITLPITLPVVE
jgi:hypothetical protein